MQDTLLDTEEKRMNALAALTGVRNNPGWLFIQAMQDANITVLAEQLENGVASETKADVDRIRDKLKLTREFRNIVDKMIGLLTPKEASKFTIDPYQTVEQLQEERKSLTEE